MRILLSILLLICNMCSVYATSIGVIDYNSGNIEQNLYILYKHYDKYLTDPYKSYLKILIKND